MDINELKTFMGEINPGKEITFDFDEKCYRKVDFTFTEGAANITHHAEFNKIRVTIDGKSTYACIAPHRVNVPWVDVKKFIMDMDEIFVPEPALRKLSDLRSRIEENASESEKEKIEFEGTLDQFVRFTGKPREDILKKIQIFEEEEKHEKN